MRILVVDPGADWSTRDVFDGLVGGLRANGAAVLPYYFGRRYAVLSKAMVLQWRSRGTTDEERGVRPTPGDFSLWPSELAVTWALRHQPDWVVVVSAMYLHPDALILFRRAGFRTAILLTETPYDVEKEAVVAGLADAAWTNERTAVDLLRTVNPQTYYLRHAYQADRHRPDAPDPEGVDVARHDVVFVGTGFQERIELLEGVDWTGIDLGLYGMWNYLPSRHRLRRHVRGGAIDNRLTTALYRRAKVGLNLFRQSMGFGKRTRRLHGAESLGPRSYELAATGCFHVSESRPEVRETFGELVPTFANAGELEAALRRWLPDDSGRTAIAARLPQAVSGHSWDVRARQVLDDLARAERRDVAA